MNNRIPTIVIDGLPLSPQISQGRDRRRAGKGKHRDPIKAHREHVHRPIPDGAVDPEKGSLQSWWLDISSPTYADMKALGKVPFLFCTATILYPQIL